MKITRDNIQTFTVESEGMIECHGKWNPIECTVEVERETEKAYYGEVLVFDCGLDDVIFEKNTWLPKSMSENPWWIVTKLFDYSGKVSNRRFENDVY